MNYYSLFYTIVRESLDDYNKKGKSTILVVPTQTKMTFTNEHQDTHGKYIE